MESTLWKKWGKAWGMFEEQSPFGGIWWYVLCSVMRLKTLWGTLWAGLFFVVGLPGVVWDI